MKSLRPLVRSFSMNLARLCALRTGFGWAIAFGALAVSPLAHAATSAARPTVDACTLLSLQELSQIVGSTVRRPRPDTAQAGTACRFSTTTDTLNITLWPTTPKEFDEFRKTLAESGATLESATGVGDAAFYWNNRIYVRVGNHGLTVWLGTPTDGVEQKRRQLVLAVAKAGAAKLR